MARTVREMLVLPRVQRSSCAELAGAPPASRGGRLECPGEGLAGMLALTWLRHSRASTSSRCASSQADRSCQLAQIDMHVQLATVLLRSPPSLAVRSGYARSTAASSLTALDAPVEGCTSGTGSTPACCAGPPLKGDVQQAAGPNRWHPVVQAPPAAANCG